jgi:uncharacterized protein (TIGR02231 family)
MRGRNRCSKEKCDPIVKPSLAASLEAGCDGTAAVQEGNIMKVTIARPLMALAVWTTAVGLASAAELEAASRIDAVTVYPDGATVTRIIEADLPAGDTTLLALDFPLTLDPASLRVEGAGAGRLVIGSVDARRPRPQPTAARPDIEKRIEALRDERGALDDKIAAANARRKFAEIFAADSPKGMGEKGEARPLGEWRAAFAAVAEEIAAADGTTREAKLRQRDIDREIARLEAETKATPPRKMEVRIDLAAEAPTRVTLSVSYNVRGARWNPLYDARLDTGTKERKPALELVRRAEILQQTGEDWADVTLSVSTVRTAKGGSAPELASLVVKYPEPPRPVASRADEARPRSAAPGAARQESLAAMPAPQAPAQEREAAVETGGFQVVFRIPGRVSIGAGEGTRSVRIASQKIAPDLHVRTTPAMDDAAYLEAAFKQTEEAPLLPGRVAVYRDGTFVGRGAMSLVPKDETVRLGFGVDEKVKVARAVVRKSEGTAGIISSSKTDEREFKTTVRNGHDTPIAITVEDQIPASEIADVQVELLPVTTPPTARDVRDRRGVLAWTFTAAPGEQREIKLGWRVRWPADKTIVYEPGRP